MSLLAGVLAFVLKIGDRILLVIMWYTSVKFVPKIYGFVIYFTSIPSIPFLIAFRFQAQGQILLAGATLTFGLTHYPYSEFELLAEELLMSDSTIKVLLCFCFSDICCILAI